MLIKLKKKKVSGGFSIVLGIMLFLICSNCMEPDSYLTPILSSTSLPEGWSRWPH